MENYNFYVWPGSGYCLDTFNASGSCLEDALENLVCDLITHGETSYFVTCEEMDRLRAEWGVDEDQDPEGYLYIDATMNGAPYPVYLHIENMKFDRLS